MFLKFQVVRAGLSDEVPFRAELNDVSASSLMETSVQFWCGVLIVGEAVNVSARRYMGNLCAFWATWLWT